MKICSTIDIILCTININDFSYIFDFSGSKNETYFEMEGVLSKTLGTLLLTLLYLNNLKCKIN